MSRRQRSRSLDRTSEQSTLVSVSMNNHRQTISRTKDTPNDELLLSSKTLSAPAILHHHTVRRRTHNGMVTACYLIETNDGRHILIDSGTAPDGRTENSSAAENE